MKTIIAVLLALTLGCPMKGAWAEDEAAPPPPPPSKSAQVALQAAGVLATGGYVPIKGLMCAMTFATTPLLWLESGKKAARDATNRACNGTWIITPEVLKGDKPFDFVYDNPCCGYPDQ
ncbi:MAG TPA: hypothetical protein VMS64_12075 [Candidatus Methylomirabilis sp.]|nr:hypothetical protein [Candidatus Methylomirabilis sp.]